MSLLPVCNNGATNQSYFIQNVGGAGAGTADVPCIQGTTLGVVRVGNPAAGLLMTGSTLGSNINSIVGGQASGGSLRLGNSSTSFQNIVLTDNLTTINTPTAIGGSNGLSIAGNLVFSGAPVGASISGYYVASVPFVAGGGAVANPAGLTTGLYSVIVVPTGAGNENAQAAAVCYYSGTAWFGNGVSFNFTGGAPNVAVGPVAGGATLNLGGATIGALSGNVVFRKLLN